MDKKMRCPICDNEIILPENIKHGDRLTCPHCSAQLALRHHRGKDFLTCPVCKEAIFDPQNCEECETRRGKKRLLEEGRL
jgi:DNA-directed RNA polymerase subunit RPC12/RpoP